jgi:hypothetical protein
VGPSTLHFKQTFNLQANSDGGVLEIAIGNGAFQDIVTAGGENKYTGSILAPSSPINGRQAWTGNVSGFNTSIVMPPAAAGQSVRLRWRLATDAATASVGWFVDNIGVTGGLPPIPSAIQSPIGPPAGGSTVMIFGSNLGGSAATVTFGGVPATNVTTPLPGNPLTVITGAHPVGRVDVVVTDQYMQSGTLTDGFTYLDPPTISRVWPDWGPPTGGTQVTIKGAVFTTNAVVTIGGIASPVSYSDASTIVTTVPAHPQGMVDVVVTNPGIASSTFTNGFAYWWQLTDDPLPPHARIQAAHLSELRARVDGIRAAHNLGAYTYTDPTIVPGLTIVKAAQITELRTALGQAYVAEHLPLPIWNTPAAPGLVITQPAIDELRAAMKRIQ